MKLFISLIAIFFLIVGCGDNDEKEDSPTEDSNTEKTVQEGEQQMTPEGDATVADTTVADTTVADATANLPVLANCTQSDGSSLDLTVGSFDCPQVASHNCSVCGLNSSVAMNGNTNVILAYTCSGSRSGSVGLTDAASFIQQLGITCSKVAEQEAAE